MDERMALVGNILVFILGLILGWVAMAWSSFLLLIDCGFVCIAS